MHKSENKIKPMYFWSDGYKECGILEPDPKKIKSDELEDVELQFEDSGRFTKRSIKRRRLKSVLKKIAETIRQGRRYTHG